MEIARVVATRSTCLRRHVGAVLVKDRQILSTGYNGVPRGLSHCAERGCLRAEMAVPSGNGTSCVGASTRSRTRSSRRPSTGSA